MSKINYRDNCSPMGYLAAPLFSDAERTYNILIAELIEKYMKVYLPQRDGGLMNEMVSNGMPYHIAKNKVFEKDMKAIQESNYLIAILDGRAIDEGVAFELGVAFSMGKRCVGLQTDSRRLAVWGNNPMISGALEIIFDSIDSLMKWLKYSLTEDCRCVKGTEV